MESIRCAIEIHDLICQDKTYQLRIGIHLGDALFKDSDIYGDGVNIASHI